jgi:hypothetical protein
MKKITRGVSEATQFCTSSQLHSVAQVAGVQWCNHGALGFAAMGCCLTTWRAALYVCMWCVLLHLCLWCCAQQLVVQRTVHLHKIGGGTMLGKMQSGCVDNMTCWLLCMFTTVLRVEVLCAAVMQASQFSSSFCVLFFAASVSNYSGIQGHAVCCRATVVSCVCGVGCCCFSFAVAGAENVLGFAVASGGVRAYGSHLLALVATLASAFDSVRHCVVLAWRPVVSALMG